MADRRPSLYCWVTWLAKLMTGECACQFQPWFYTHHRLPRDPNDAQNLSRQISHTQQMSKVVRELTAQGQRCQKEARVAIDWVDPYSRTTVRIDGRIDCYIDDGRRLTIYDCKTGAQRGSHHAQVLTYLFLLSSYVRFDSRQLRGVIRYADADPVIVDGLPPNFSLQLNDFLSILASDTPPPTSPGWDCHYCKVSADDCAHRSTRGDGLDHEVPIIVGGMGDRRSIRPTPIGWP